MNARRLVPLVLLAPLFTANCGDATTPVHAQTAQLAQIEAKLDQVLERLDALDAGRAEQFNQIDATLASYDERFTQIETVLGDVNDGVSQIAANLGVSVGATAAVESSICASSSLDANLSYKALLALRGQAKGTLGVNAYGNGGMANLQAYISQRLNARVEPAVNVSVQFCGKLSGQTGVNAGMSIDPSDPIIALLEDAASMGTGQLQATASALNMTGTRTQQAVDMLTNLSADQLFSSRIGNGGAPLANVLPLPAGMRALIESPRTVLSDAQQIAQSSIDLLCDQQMRVGEFANMLQTGCDLRDQVPPPADIIDIISDLDGIGVTLNNMDMQLASMCNAFGTVADQRLSFSFGIPPRTLDILGSTYVVFPGYSYSYNELLFPGFQPPTC